MITVRGSGYGVLAGNRLYTLVFTPYFVTSILDRQTPIAGTVTRENYLLSA